MSHLEPEAIELAASSTPAADIASHLASCTDCRKAVSSARGRQRLLRGMKPYTLSDMGFRRVEAKLDEAVREGLPSTAPWWRWLGLGLGATAAAALAFVLMTRGPVDDNVVNLPIPKIELARADFRPLTVVRAENASARLGEAAWRAVLPGEVLAAGEAVSADSITLSDESTEWSLVATGSLSLGGAATVTLGTGSITAKVDSKTTALEVLASTRQVIATTALFQLTRTGAEVALQVSEGQVEVVDSESGQRRVVKAPSALRWSDDSALAEARSETVAALTGPAIPAKPWVRFDASTLGAGTVVSLDGAQLGTAPFIEMVTAGRRRLGLTPPNAVLVESWVELVGGDGFVPKIELPVATLEGPEPDAAALSRVMAELKRQTPKLSACYEKWLKANPAAQGEVVLELTVSAQGRVKKARVGQSSISAASAECLVTTAKSLVLSPLGVDATLEVPLLLRTPGR